MVTVDLYSDVICPWCYIGKRRTEKGRAYTAVKAAEAWAARESAAPA